MFHLQLPVKEKAGWGLLYYLCVFVCVCVCLFVFVCVGEGRQWVGEWVDVTIGRLHKHTLSKCHLLSVSSHNMYVCESERVRE